MASPIFVFNATTGSPAKQDGSNTISVISLTWRPYQFNATHLSSAGPLLLPDNVSSVYSMRSSHPPTGSVNSSSKKSWKEHLQQHFCQLEDTYNLSLNADETKVVLCPDPRCTLSFESVQDLQCYCQDIHCIKRTGLDPVKQRRLTR